MGPMYLGVRAVHRQVVRAHPPREPHQLGHRAARLRRPGGLRRHRARRSAAPATACGRRWRPADRCTVENARTRRPLHRVLRPDAARARHPPGRRHPGAHEGEGMTQKRIPRGLHAGRHQPLPRLPRARTCRRRGRSATPSCSPRSAAPTPTAASSTASAAASRRSPRRASSARRRCPTPTSTTRSRRSRCAKAVGRLQGQLRQLLVRGRARSRSTRAWCRARGRDARAHPQHQHEEAHRRPRAGDRRRGRGGRRLRAGRRGRARRAHRARLRRAGRRRHRPAAADRPRRATSSTASRSRASTRPTPWCSCARATSASPGTETPAGRSTPITTLARAPREAPRRGRRAHGHARERRRAEDRVRGAADRLHGARRRPLRRRRPSTCSGARHLHGQLPSRVRRSPSRCAWPSPPASTARVVHEVAAGATPRRRRLGHPSGVLPIDARVDAADGAPWAETVTVYRTARG